MASGTNIKDRCRLCYTRLKDSLTSHHKLWYSHHNHRLYNIYKRRPFRYRDLIVRYLCIRLPENDYRVIDDKTNNVDRYSQVVCEGCATALVKLDTAFRTFQRTQKILRAKYRKTSHIVHYQLDKQPMMTTTTRQKTSTRIVDEQPKPTTIIPPKRQSKRKGAPKHIDQTSNSSSGNAKTMPTKSGGVQLIVKMQTPVNDDDDDDDAIDMDDSSQTRNLFHQLPLSPVLSSSSTPIKRRSPRRKPFRTSEDILTGQTNPKKRFKRISKDRDISTNNVSESLSNHEYYDCINLLKSNSATTDIALATCAPLNLTTSITPGSLSSTSNSRLFNSVKGNHIERIAVSLLSGTDSLSDNSLHLSNGTVEQGSDPVTTKTRTRRKPNASAAAAAALEATTTNNILCPTSQPSFTTVANIRSPSLDEPDEDGLSGGGASNDSSSTSRSALRLNSSGGGTTSAQSTVAKQLASTISTTPTAEGLTITAINQTGQKQVFMAKQLGNLKKYQCGLCEKIVTNIQIHVRRHTNDKPYPCTYCEKRFTNSGDLQIHVRIHTGEKPYACPLCLKSYRTIGNFNSHVKTHDSGSRPHRCELCDQTFPIPKDWYSHLRSSHRSRIPNNNATSTVTSTTTTTTNPTTTLSSPNTSNTTTTVTQPLFSNALSSQQQHNEIFVPNKVKLEPIDRSQLLIKTTNNNDDQEPVNMSKKEEMNNGDNLPNTNHENEDEDDEEEDVDDDVNDEVEGHSNNNHHHPSTRNLLTTSSSVSSPVHA